MAKQKLKINFVGFWSNFNKTQNLFYSILSERFQVEISDTPDFVFASILGTPLDYLKYDCIRILFAGEPLVPDFNLFDYAIGFDHLSFPDIAVGNRYYRYPLCLYHIERVLESTQGLTLEQAKDALAAKKYFCNFLYGHRSAKGERELLLQTVQTYQRVESAGSFLNNMPDGTVIPYSEKKIDFLKLCKFTIACESISYPGFITEKIINPFYGNSIPIYYGNPLSALEFNSEAIINCHDFPDFDSALQRVIEVDQNDELYLRMLMMPKFASEDYLKKMYDGLKDFLWSIVSQPPNTAYRRLRHYIQAEHEHRLDEYRRFHTSIFYRIHRKLRPKDD